MTDGKLTYKRILNATQYEIERFLKEYGYREYIGYSRYYLADFFREKAILRGKDYYV
jgi:hypothetical protein